MTAMTETSGMVQITNRLWPFFSAIIIISQKKLGPLFLQNYHWSKQVVAIIFAKLLLVKIGCSLLLFLKVNIDHKRVTTTFIDHKRVEPGKFRIGRVGRAHNDYYEVTLKDRY